MSYSGTNSLRGRIYEDIHGPEKTVQLLEKRRIAKLGSHHKEESRLKMIESHIGKVVSSKTKEKIALARRGKSYEEVFGTEKAQVLRRIRQQAKLVRPTLNFRHSSPHTETSRQKIIKTPVTHHRDFDHSNDSPENRKEITRKKHSKIHSQSGARAVIFIKNALDKGIITKDFYEEFLVEINQEESDSQIGEL